MEKEFIYMKMERHLKENLLIIKNMKVMDLFMMKMDIFIKEKLKKVKKME